MTTLNYFISSFLTSLSVTFIAEAGDRTFFITASLAMKLKDSLRVAYETHSLTRLQRLTHWLRWVLASGPVNVFAGAWLALIAQTVICCIIGVWFSKSIQSAGFDVWAPLIGACLLLVMAYVSIQDGLECDDDVTSTGSLESELLERPTNCYVDLEDNNRICSGQSTTANGVHRDNEKRLRTGSRCDTPDTSSYNDGVAGFNDVHPHLNAHRFDLLQSLQSLNDANDSIIRHGSEEDVDASTTMALDERHSIHEHEDVYHKHTHIEFEAEQPSPTIVYPSIKTVLLNTWKAFFAVFSAELGDKSMFTTITLASSMDPVGVLLGGVLAHGILCAFAVTAARMIRNLVNERVMAFTCAGIFIGCALFSFGQFFSKL